MGEYTIPKINYKDQQFDETTFNQFFKEYYDKLYNYIYFTLKNARQVEDLTSEILEKVIRNLSTFQSEKSSLNTWIFAIAKNHLKDFYRMKQGKEEGLDPDDSLRIPDQITPSPEGALLETEKQEIFRELMNTLPEPEREMVALKFWGRLKNVEIASQMHRTPNQVNVSIHRSLKKLKTAIEEGNPTWANLLS